MLRDVVGGRHDRIADAHHQSAGYGHFLSFSNLSSAYIAYFIDDGSVRTRRFTIEGVYQTNMTRFDEVFCYTDLSSAFIAYFITVNLYNVYDFVETVRSAVRTRKGEIHRWYLYSTITDKICSR